MFPLNSNPNFPSLKMFLGLGEQTHYNYAYEALSKLT